MLSLAKLKITFWKVLRTLTGKTLYEKLRTKRCIGYFPNIKNPRTFNEFIINHKLYGVGSYAVQLADKYEVREFIEAINPSLLIELYYVGDNPEKIPFEELPEQYVVKTTHSSGDVFIVQDKNKADINKIKQGLKEGLNYNLGFLKNEWWYSKMKPQFVIEELLKDEKGQVPMDYKIFCFNGKCKFIQLNLNRYTGHQRIFYDMNWQKQNYGLNIGDNVDVPKPDNFDELIRVAELLAKDFKFVRVDLYSVDNKIKFGELTFAPLSGHEKFDSYEEDLALAKFWTEA